MVDIQRTDALPHHSKMLQHQRLPLGSQVASIWHPAGGYLSCHLIHHRGYYFKHRARIECDGWDQSVLEIGIGLQVLNGQHHVG